jgi:hypothetical protein
VTSNTTSPGISTPKGTPVPSGFQPDSASFVSAQTGFVLGLAQCQIDPVGGHFCLTIARTQDGGKTWSSIPTPGADLVPAPTLNGSHNAVSRIKFTSVLDGYLYGPDLYATHDGGKTWKKLIIQGIPTAYGVSSLESTRSNTFIILARPDTALPGSDYLLSAIRNSDAFAIQKVPAVSTSATPQISANESGLMFSTNRPTADFYYRADASTELESKQPAQAQSPVTPHLHSLRRARADPLRNWSWGAAAIQVLEAKIKLLFNHLISRRLPQQKQSRRLAGS